MFWTFSLPTQLHTQRDQSVDQPPSVALQGAGRSLSTRSRSVDRTVSGSCLGDGKGKVVFALKPAYQFSKLVVHRFFYRYGGQEELDFGGSQIYHPGVKGC